VEVIEDLTRVLAKKLIMDVTFSIRASAEDGDLRTAEALVKAVTRGERISSSRDAAGKPDT
jgi:glutamyl-tRNA reductase